MKSIVFIKHENQVGWYTVILVGMKHNALNSNMIWAKLDSVESNLKCKGRKFKNSIQSGAVKLFTLSSHLKFIHNLFDWIEVYLSMQFGSRTQFVL